MNFKRGKSGLLTRFISNRIQQVNASSYAHETNETLEMAKNLDTWDQVRQVLQEKHSTGFPTLCNVFTEVTQDLSAKEADFKKCI